MTFRKEVKWEWKGWTTTVCMLPWNFRTVFVCFMYHIEPHIYRMRVKYMTMQRRHSAIIYVEKAALKLLDFMLYVCTLYAVYSPGWWSPNDLYIKHRLRLYISEHNSKWKMKSLLWMFMRRRRRRWRRRWQVEWCEVEDDEVDEGRWSRQWCCGVARKKTTVHIHKHIYTYAIFYGVWETTTTTTATTRTIKKTATFGDAKNLTRQGYNNVERKVVKAVTVSATAPPNNDGFSSYFLFSTVQQST